MAYAELGQGGDPLVIMIGVAWAADGYCSGQFTVRAAESAAEIRVSAVVEQVMPQGSACAGLGSVDGTARAPLRLAAPLGDRPVIRDSDGLRLPDRTRIPG